MGRDSVSRPWFYSKRPNISDLHVLSIHLMELSPPAFRTFVVGTSYQLGNLVSSASATIEATIGQQFPLPPKITGKKVTQRYQYGKVICIFLGCVSFPSCLYSFAQVPVCRNDEQRLIFSHRSSHTICSLHSSAPKTEVAACVSSMTMTLWM